jgi:hypothetical protein
MRIAVLTDPHASREATEAVAAAVRALAPDRIMLDQQNLHRRVRVF